MAERLVEEEWKKVEMIGYCPLMSQGGELVDCKRERCTWWRGKGPGRPKGKSACAVNELVSQLSALNARLQIGINDLVSQFVILNGRLQAVMKGDTQK